MQETSKADARQRADRIRQFQGELEIIEVQIAYGGLFEPWIRSVQALD